MGGTNKTRLSSAVNFFFFQAEDGIRDVAVTGVQTCALPISRVRPYRPGDLHRCLLGKPVEPVPRRLRYVFLREHDLQGSGAVAQHHEADLARRSEERRVGKECRSCWWLSCS